MKSLKMALITFSALIVILVPLVMAGYGGALPIRVLSEDSIKTFHWNGSDSLPYADCVSVYSASAFWITRYFTNNTYDGAPIAVPAGASFNSPGKLCSLTVKTGADSAFIAGWVR